MKTGEQLSDELGGKLCDILVGQREMVTRWVAVAEVIGSDGRRYLRTFWPDGLTRWDGKGMLSCAAEDFAPGYDDGGPE